jgi:hypothetical protein
LPALSAPTPKPPAGPGSSVSKRRGKQQGSKRGKLDLIQLTPLPAAERVAAVMAEAPGIGIRDLAERAGVSVSTATKYRLAHRRAHDWQAAHGAAQVAQVTHVEQVAQ